MKKIFFIAAILGFVFASAQQGRPYLKIIPPGSNTLNGTPNVYQLNPANRVIARAELSHVLANGNKVYLLSQDNMPCVVPDLQNYNMPVVVPDIQQYNMPNPANPSQGSNGVITVSPEKLKEMLEKYRR